MSNVRLSSFGMPTPFQPIVNGRCQFDDTIYRFSFPFGLARSSLRTLRTLRHDLRKSSSVGEPSRFHEGDWVRVKEEDEIRATLDGENKLRGVLFMGEWGFCGRTYQIDRVMLRLRDDTGRFRAISRTVTLAGATCDGMDGTNGCGRSCAVSFCDEWLELSSEEHHVARPLSRFARVRPWDEIVATLDRNERRDGVRVMPEMERFAGKRFGVLRRAGDVGIELPGYKMPAADFFILDGVRCTGAVFAAEGPCHGNCAILWHRDWLEFEDD